jgi:putative oxidoreductase
MLSGTMITAIRKVHASKGVWASDGGYEYNLVLLAIVFAISDVGPGRLSLDAARGREHKGLHWALAQLAAAAIGSTLGVTLGERQAPAGSGQPTATAGTGETSAADGTVSEMADASAA